jgi:RNA polymerase sigma factor FliA
VVKLKLKQMTKKELNHWEIWQQQREPESGEYLVEKYLPLVDYVVQRFMISLPKTVEKDDIHSLALEGLLDSLDKFDLSRDLKFETYASWRIKGAIIDGLRKSDWLPRSVRQQVKKIEQAYVDLEQEYNRPVTDKEVSDHLGITKAELNKTVSEAALSTMISMDQTVQDDSGQVALVNMIENNNAESPEQQLMESVLKETLANAIDRLPENEKITVSLCYFEELTLTEIAEVLNLSVGRISQLHSKAMLRLRAAIVSVHDNY